MVWINIILGGNTLNEIANLSKGAQIIILNDKHKKRKENETIVVIVGKLEMKTEAAAIITEKIAGFRYTAKVHL